MKTYKIKPIEWKGVNSSYANYGGFHFEIYHIDGKFVADVYTECEIYCICTETFDKERDAHDWCEKMALETILKNLEEV